MRTDSRLSAQSFTELSLSDADFRLVSGVGGQGRQRLGGVAHDGDAGTGEQLHRRLRARSGHIAGEDRHAHSVSADPISDE